MITRLRALVERAVQRQARRAAEADRRWRETLGPNFTACPMCNGGAMSRAALAEHLRVRHGDS